MNRRYPGHADVPQDPAEHLVPDQQRPGSLRRRRDRARPDRARRHGLGRRVREAVQQAAVRVRSAPRTAGSSGTATTGGRATATTSAGGAARALHRHGHALPRRQRPRRHRRPVRALVLTRTRLRAFTCLRARRGKPENLRTRDHGTPGPRWSREADRRRHHVLHDGLHRGGEPGHPLATAPACRSPGALTATVLVCVTHDAADGPLRAPAVRRRAGHGPQRLLRLHADHRQGVPWPVALGIVFWAGVLFLIASVTPLRERIAMAIPRLAARRPRRPASACCSRSSGCRTRASWRPNPATIVGVGPLDHRALLALLGLFVSVRLPRRQPARLPGRHLRRDRGGLGGRMGGRAPARWFSAPDFSSRPVQARYRGRPHAGRWRRPSSRC